MTSLYNAKIKPLKFKESSKYPEIVKDLAFVIDKNIESEVIKSQIKKSGGRLLDSIDIFDLYENIEEGKKSIAVGVTFQPMEKTYTDQDIEILMNKVIQDVKKKCNAELR